MSLKPHNKIRNSQTLIYMLLLVLVISAMVGLRLMSKSNTHIDATSENSGLIRVAVVYGPNSYRVLTTIDGKDSIAGINYYLLKDLEDSLGISVEMHPVIDRDETLAKVESGYFDILASLPADNYLKENFLTTDAICLDKLVLLQRKNADGSLPIKSALELAGDTIHVKKGSSAVRRIHNLNKEIGDSIHIVEEEGLSEEYLAMKVASGALRYAVVNEKTANGMHRNYPELDYSTPVSFTQFQVWVLPLGHDSLLNKVNQFLKDSAIGR